MAGAATIQASGFRLAVERVCVLSVCSHTALVTSAMARSNSHAVPEPPAPTKTAMATSMRTRRSVVKSPRRGSELAGMGRGILVRSG